MTKTLADRIRARLEELDISMTEAARRVGKKKDLYNNYLRGQSSEPRKATLALMAKGLETTPEWLLTGKHPENDNSPAPEGFTLVNTDHFFESPTPLPIWGEVAAGLWLEADQYQAVIDERPSRLLPNPDYPLEAQFVVTVNGESLNKKYPNGSQLLCVNLYKAQIAQHELVNDDLVIVQRHRSGSNTVETTAKYLRFNGAEGYFELWPNSSDPRFQLPLIVGEGKNSDADQLTQEEGEEVRVMALVVGAHVPVIRGRR